jgi:hypothetical protein
MLQTHGAMGEGFLQATEAGTRVGTDVIKIQALQDIHHEIRARPVSGVNIDSGSRGGRFQCDLVFGWRGCGSPFGLGLLCLGDGGRCEERSRSTGSAFQKIATVTRNPFCFFPFRDLPLLARSVHLPSSVRECVHFRPSRH